MHLTEAEDVKKRRKNTQKNCTIEIFTTKEAGIYSGAKTASSIKLEISREILMQRWPQ